MSVYVDELPSDPAAGWGKWAGGAHMTCSDLDELHAMAAKLRLRRSWFQDRTFPHYDLTASKRRLAIQHGAIEIEAGHNPPDTLMKCRDGGYETYEQRMPGRQP